MLAYVITCIPSGKQYVGITSRSLSRRWSEHLYDARNRHSKMAISRAIAKHGAENFTITAICCALCWDDLCVVETILIVQNLTRAPHGYNLSDGGDGAFGVKKTAESVERSAAKHRGKPCHSNTIAAARARKGQKKPLGHGAKVSAALRGIPRSDATKQKLSAYWAIRRAAGDFKTSAPYEHRRSK